MLLTVTDDVEDIRDRTRAKSHDLRPVHGSHGRPRNKIAHGACLELFDSSTTGIAGDDTSVKQRHEHDRAPLGSVSALTSLVRLQTTLLLVIGTGLDKS